MSTEKWYLMTESFFKIIDFLKPFKVIKFKLLQNPTTSSPELLMIVYEGWDFFLVDTLNLKFEFILAFIDEETLFSD
jgi:hypothetical protein